LGPGLLLLSVFLFRLENGNEIGTYAAGFQDLVGDALFGKEKVPFGFFKGRIDDRVLYDNLFHSSIPYVCVVGAASRSLP
jgi:hypothetical protein